MSAEDLVACYRELRRIYIPLGDHPTPIRDKPKADAPVALIFAAHPDDEVLIGPLAHRLRSAGWRIVVAVRTLGSASGQQARRHAELERACEFLGFELETPGAELSILAILARHNPSVVITHHEADAHPRHRAVSRDVTGLLRLCQWPGFLFEAEYWSDMEGPNMLLEVDPDALAFLVTALTFHKGEVERNPYHLEWPATMMRAIRRAEVVLGPGSRAPDFDFGVMYRRSKLVGDAMLPAPLNTPTLRWTDPVSMVLE